MNPGCKALLHISNLNPNVATNMSIKQLCKIAGDTISQLWSTRNIYGKHTNIIPQRTFQPAASSHCPNPSLLDGREKKQKTFIHWNLPSPDVDQTALPQPTGLELRWWPAWQNWHRTEASIAKLVASSSVLQLGKPIQEPTWIPLSALNEALSGHDPLPVEFAFFETHPRASLPPKTPKSLFSWISELYSIYWNRSGWMKHSPPSIVQDRIESNWPLFGEYILVECWSTEGPHLLAMVLIELLMFEAKTSHGTAPQYGTSAICHV